ncbi:carboxylesterase family protein [Occultella glacieicola]|uniref:Carboxylic ester hydrolase n=1 Tax=Occultella glacieicola TaxID=2518684 RepID=A0ABY2E9D0_9MICO|nr:carboxylesterase family protein [Occultella glacieicola]TDE99108.1 carboxylesterase family protein [Occultella glacieicola]
MPTPQRAHPPIPRVLPIITVVLTVAAILGLPGPAAAGPGRTVVATDGGLVRGTLHDGTRTFQGIPYAAPPVGELRWRAPEPPEPWRGVRDATTPGPACAQNPGELPEGSTSEDCLSLNVTTPAGATDEPLPVILWVHGGGFYQGASHNYDATRLATRGDAVVITINYRLGMFGFLGLPGLEGSGTFGLADQQAAMAWVQRNAAAFGGDPDNVTLAGQSAGAVSTCAQLASPGAAGLFDRAIMQSGSCDLAWLANTVYQGQPADDILLPVATVQERGRALATELGCSSDHPDAVLDCLRALPVETLRPVMDGFIQPAYGTDLLPIEPSEAIATGAFNRVPVLSGHTRDESTLEVVGYEGGAGPMGEQTYEEVMTETFGEDRAAVEEVYPRSAYPSGAAAWAAIATDSKWAAGQYATSAALSRYVPVHQYEFSDPAPPFSSPAPMNMGAYHTSELWSFFSLSGVEPTLTPAQQHLADQLIDYWAAFAATGDPGSAAGPAWPRFDGTADTPYVQSFAPGAIAPVDVAAEHHLDFWRTLMSGR